MGNLLTVNEVLGLCKEKGYPISGRTLKYYIEEGLVSSVLTREARKGKRGSGGLYPEHVVEEVIDVKKRLANGARIKEIKDKRESEIHASAIKRRNGVFVFTIQVPEKKFTKDKVTITLDLEGSENKKQFSVSISRKKK